MDVQVGPTVGQRRVRPAHRSTGRAARALAAARARDRARSGRRPPTTARARPPRGVRTRRPPGSAGPRRARAWPLVRSRGRHGAAGSSPGGPRSAPRGYVGRPRRVGAPDSRASSAAPTGSGAGAPKNGTGSPPPVMSRSATMPTSSPGRARREAHGGLLEADQADPGRGPGLRHERLERRVAERLHGGHHRRARRGERASPPAPGATRWTGTRIPGRTAKAASMTSGDSTRVRPGPAHDRAAHQLHVRPWMPVAGADQPVERGGIVRRGRARSPPVRATRAATTRPRFARTGQLAPAARYQISPTASASPHGAAGRWHASQLAPSSGRRAAADAGRAPRASVRRGSCGP